MLYKLFFFSLQLIVIYEIWKLTKLNFNFKLKCIFYDYREYIVKRVNSNAFKQFLKINMIEFYYGILTVIGLFTQNNIFFLSLIMLSLCEYFSFKFIKNKKIKKGLFILNIILSISLLVLTIINIKYFNLNNIEYIKKIITWLN